MSIDIHPLFGFFAFISQSVLEPPLCCRFNNCAFDLERGKDDIIDMFAQGTRSYSAQVLSSKINAHVLQDSFVVEEGVVATPGIHFRKREASILQEVQLNVLDLISKVRASAHPACNGHACLEAWLFAWLVHLVMCAKFDILGHCNKAGKQFHCLLRFVPPNVLEASLYDLHNICWFIILL